MIKKRSVNGKASGLVYAVVEETLPGGKKRTLSIEGAIRNSPGQKRWTTGPKGSGFDIKGHLIADRFGGPNTRSSGNIVPMHDVINKHGGLYYQFEDHIAKFIG